VKCSFTSGTWPTTIPRCVVPDPHRNLPKPKFASSSKQSFDDDVDGSHALPLVPAFVNPRGSSMNTLVSPLSAFPSINKPTSGSLVLAVDDAPAKTTTCAPALSSLTKTILTVLSFSNPVFDSACDAVEPMFARL
jgi:hypothetical protein|tara:strand:- start:749 stop:1153 length:405 start_codon:yes stop_codon:yes gene_type:complete